MEIGGKAVFLGEFDDDYQQLHALDEAALSRRLVCYYLLAPHIVLHPAYIWQSPLTHHLVFGQMNELLRPPFTRVELGRYPSVNDYMDQRLNKVRRSSEPTRELHAYESHGESLLEEARTLTIRFDLTRLNEVEATLRDQRFRGLVIGDVGATDFNEQSLAARFVAFAKAGGADMKQVLSFVDKLQEFARTRELVSVDTILKFVYENGYPLVEDYQFKERLLALYYETYADDDTLIPATHKLRPGTVVNPYDVDVFWQVMRVLFGEECEALATPADTSVLLLLRDLRESTQWVAFQQLYVQAISGIDDALWADPERVAESLGRHLQGRTLQYVRRELWRRNKLELGGIAASVIASPSIAIATTGARAVAAAAGGIVGAGISIGSLGAAIKHRVAEYRDRDVVKVRKQVTERVLETLHKMARTGGVHAPN
jgi:hypothetical protein